MYYFSQMYVNVVLCILVACILYTYTQHERQFAATSSAIQQIWSGSCRLSCRQTGKIDSPDRAYNDQYADQEGASSSHAGPYNDCVCESCPCGLLENVLRSCSPATEIYTSIMRTIFQAYYDLIKMCTDLYDQVFDSVQNQDSVRKSIQLTTTKYLTPTTNFTFDESAKIKIKRVTLNKSDVQPRKHDEEVVFGTDPGTSGTNQSNNEVQSPAKENVKFETADAIVGSDCPSCVEKGVTCIDRCLAERNNHLSTLAKILLITLLIAFIIHCPLGDPCAQLPEHSVVRWSDIHNYAVGYVCKLYRIAKRGVCKVTEMVKVFISLTSNALYRTKITLYKKLGQIDVEDLCRYACCKESDMDQNRKVRAKRSPCRCQ